MGIAFRFENPRQHKKFRSLIEKLAGDKAGKLYQEPPETARTTTDKLESHRHWAEVNVEKAEAALEGKRFQEAIEWYQEAIRAYPHDPSFHLRLGVAGYLKALEETPSDQPLPAKIRNPFLKALALNPQYDEPRVYLGYIAVRNGNLERALKEFTGALECNPANKVARVEANVLQKRLAGRSRE
jgi:tetratricopeptide (TPR) repeat protein